MLLPTIKVPKSMAKYRGATPSEELNDFVNQSAEDISQLFIAINENTNKLSNIQSVTYAENRCLVDMIATLQAEIMQKDAIIAGNTTRTIYAGVNEIQPLITNPANISVEYQQILPYNNTYTPKLYIHDTVSNKNIVPKVLTDSLTIAQSVIDISSARISNDEVITIDNGIVNAFDGDLTTCWQRIIKSPKDLNADYLELQVTFPIPYEVVSNRNINTISITTHPIRGLEIVNVEIKNGDQWLQLEGFTDHSAYKNGHMLNARPVRFYFNKTTTLEVRITIRQKQKLTENDYDIFYIGAYTIDVGYTDLKNREGNFSLQMTLGTNTTANTIKSISALMDNKSIAGDSLSYELHYVAGNNSNVFVSGQLPVSIPSNKIILTCKTTALQSVIPAISYLLVEYEPVV